MDKKIEKEKKLKLIIDCDPGIDDTLALFLAIGCKKFDIIGITTVYGNHPDVSVLAKNACYICELAQASHIPVYVGASRPLVRPFTGETGMLFHGPHGQGYDQKDPVSKKPNLSLSAAEFMVQASKEYREQLAIITLGPLTNMALAIALDAALPTRIHQLSVMGGAYASPGNATPVAEANFRNDPEAARNVLQASWKNLPLLCGLDVTRKVLLTPSFFEEIAQKGGKCAQFIHQIKAFYFDRFKTIGFPQGSPMHDSTAVLALFDLDLFSFESVYVEVETMGSLTMGMSVADWKNHYGKSKNVRVALSIDEKKALAYVREVLIHQLS